MRTDLSRWVCNICRIQAETNVGVLPPGWGAYMFHGGNEVIGHVCNRCAGELGLTPAAQPEQTEPTAGDGCPCLSRPPGLRHIHCDPADRTDLTVTAAGGEGES